MNSFQSRGYYGINEFMQNKLKEATGQVSVRFTPEQYAEIVAICDAEDRKAANVVKVLVREALECRKQANNPSPAKQRTDQG